MARKKPAPVADPFDVVRRLRNETDEVAVAFSCGKDSAACLELCRLWFDRVAAFYMYVVPNISFHEQYLRFWEDRCGERLVGRSIVRLPHWALSRDLRAGYMRPAGLDAERVPSLTVRDVEVEVAKRTGVTWFAHGMKMADSLERRAMLSQCNGIMVASHRAYPLKDWTNRSVTQYLREREVPLSPEYAWLGRSYGGHLEGDYLVALRDNSPDDYRRVLERFPYAEAEVFRYEEGLKGVAGKDGKRKTGRAKREA